MLANAGIEASGFMTGIGADEEYGIRFFNAIYFTIEGIGGTEVDSVGDRLTAERLVEGEIVRS